MRTTFAIMFLTLGAASALAQTLQSGQPPTVVPSPFQSLSNIIHNRNAPPPPPPKTGNGRPLALPTAIPPNIVGANPGR
jgi:hypothetical protein